LKAFVDTNILVYSLGVDPRVARAREVIEAMPVISAQVLNEFVNVAQRKMKLTWAEIDEALADFTDLMPEIMPITLRTHQLGVQIARKHGFHIYDSMIIASASLAGCGILYTEDLSDGALIAGVQIRNPFKSPAPSPL
jgi:predicted nucleic acid-binding protein